MNHESQQPESGGDGGAGAAPKRQVWTVSEHIVDIVSDSGEGAQTAGQMFGTICGKMGNGVWTVEIIPAEIEPPARSRAGASGNRIRFGTDEVTNAGDTAHVVVAFNEQVLYSRVDQHALKEGTRIFLEKKWATDPMESIRQAYQEALADFKTRGYLVYEVPMEEECLKYVSDARRGKNMFVVGLLCALYDRDTDLVKTEIEKKFRRKGQQIIDNNLQLLQAGYAWGTEHLDFQYRVPAPKETVARVVMNGNQAVGLGAMAAGIEVCAMYPITPATSVSHYLGEALIKVGGFVHQAEDEIAAIGFAIGASYAGKTPITVTSGPGLALKTEFIGLAVMAELPLVIVDVQRGGPSTGLPTKVEQGDLLTTLYGEPGDAPKIVMAASTIEECFHFVVLARKLAEMYRGPVILHTDANLATGVQSFPKPNVSEDWFSPPIDQSPWNKEVRPYEWDAQTGFSQRPIPGMRDGNYVLTGLAHDEESHVAYVSDINQRAMEARSRKLSAVQKTLKPPTVFGPEAGDLLVVGWGSTRGAIEEAVARLQAEGHAVSSLQIRFLSPLEPGLKKIFSRFKKVMTVEINYSDTIGQPSITEESRRFAQLATILRAATLVDVDCWSQVPGYPLHPGVIEDVLKKELA